MGVAETSVCAQFHEAVELIGARWTGAILQVLMRGPMRYADLRTTVPEISDRMLSDRLRLLERGGIVIRQVIPESPVRVEYALTEKGKALEPALAAIGAWAHRWATPATAARGDRPASTTATRIVRKRRARSALP